MEYSSPSFLNWVFFFNWSRKLHVYHANRISLFYSFEWFMSLVRTRTPPPFPLKKEGGSMVQGQVFLKGGGRWHFSYLIFSRFIIFTFRNYFTLSKIVSCIWRKKIFSATIILWKKVIQSCLKINLKISHKLR